MKNLKSPCILVLGLAMSIASSCQLRAQTYTPVHSFSPWSKDGCCQGSPGLLAEGIDGNIYGTNPSQLGGYGTLISYSPSSGVFFTPANFQGGLNGDTPQSGLTLGADGYLYGTTLRGGTNKVGTVVRSAGGIPTGIYSFLNGKDGAYPWAPPVQTPDGNLWGVTYNGALQGTVYRLTPAGVLTYTNVLPSQTKAPLILAADGNLYGTTTGGGTYNAGTVFQLTPGGTITIVHSFNSSTEGYSPSGPVMQGSDGRLYGTTHWGGTNGLGTVYRVSTNGSGFFTLHQFQNSAMTKEGDYPNSGLVQGSDGYLYGVAPSGGSTGYGTLFKLDTVGNNFTSAPQFRFHRRQCARRHALAAHQRQDLRHDDGWRFGLRGLVQLRCWVDAVRQPDRSSDRAGWHNHRRSGTRLLYCDGCFDWSHFARKVKCAHSQRYLHDPDCTLPPWRWWSHYRL